MAEPLLRVENLSKRFGDLTALEGVTFTLQAGEILGVVGRPGAGKSTLLHLLSGLHAPTAGQLYCEGRPVNFTGPGDAQRLGIQIVYQRPQLLNDRDVMHNIFLGQEAVGQYGLRGMNFDQMAHQTQSLLADFDLPKSLIGKRVDGLSAEQRQVVAIARTLCQPARLILLDNALAPLDYPRQQNLLQRLKALAAKGVALVISSDDLKCLFTLTDRLLILYEGRPAGLRRTTESVPSEIVDLIVGANRQEQITPIIWALESYHATQKQTDELRRMQITLNASLEAQASLNRKLIERLRRQIQALDRLGTAASETQAHAALNPLREFELITLARVLIYQGRLRPEGIYLSEAVTLLERLLQAAEANRGTEAMTEILILQALALQGIGHTDLALAALQRALALAEPRDDLNVFIVEGQPMAALLQTLKADGRLSGEKTALASTRPLPHAAYVDKLLTAFSKTESGLRKNAPPEDSRAAFTFLSVKESLSERELAVLRLIAAGLSAQDIAQELVVSINTVKSHTKSIYSKLNVRNRAQAIKLARELNLL